MRTRHPAVLVAAVLALSAALTACGSGGDDSAAPGKTAKEEGPGPVPSPDSAQKKKLIDALKAIDPRLAEPEERAVQGALVTCEALANGVPRQTVVDTAAGNFAGAGQGEVDAAAASADKAKADKIVAAVESSFCKT